MSLDRRSTALQSLAYAALRVIAALVLMQHALQKLFGMLGNPQRPAPPADPFSLMWFVGILELVGGLLVAAGLFTRPLAFLLAGEMAVAYFWKHAPNSFFPVVNRGEPAVLLCWTFLLFAAAGGGRFSLDALRSRGGDAGRGTDRL